MMLLCITPHQAFAADITTSVDRNPVSIQHLSDIVRMDTKSCFKGAASKYRDDKQHQAASDALGESERRR